MEMEKNRTCDIKHVINEILEICRRYEVTYAEFQSILMVIRKDFAERARMQ